MGYTLHEDAKKIEADVLKLKTDAELVEYVCDNARGAAILSSRGHGMSSYDDKCGLAYDEATRRGKPDLYKRGHDMAVRSFGYTP